MVMKHTGVRLLGAVLAILLLLGSGNAMAEDTISVYFNYNNPDAHGGVEVAVVSGQTVTQPDEPVREGYRFNGWYTNVTCNKAYDFTQPVTEKLRLFAGWVPTSITVTFQMNTEGDESVQQTVAVGEKIPAMDAPVREGYEFLGWGTNAAGTALYDFDQPAPGWDVTLYAIWKQESASVTYVLYDDVTMSAQAEFGQSLERPADPEREDYAFDDWYTTMAGSEKYDFSAAVTANVRVYAHWNQTVATVTFDGNDASVEPVTVKQNIGEPLTDVPKPKRDSYRFTDWYVDAAATQIYDLTQPVTEDMTLYAGWKKRTYTITFDEHYDKGSTTKVKAEYGALAEAPADPSRKGYDFVGWYVDEDGKELYNVSTPVTASMTVYAMWQSTEEASSERVYTYMLNYDDQGVYETQTFTSTRRVKAPDNPVRPGYYFAGWCKDAEGTTFYDFANERSTQSITLFAKWLKGYTFEAEYTYLDGKPGQGSSDNCMGVDLIQSPKDVLGNGTQMGMSNGYYVGKLYYNGAFLVFDIHSDREVNDATLVLRLTPDLFDMRFTDETWQVIVNDQRLEYGRLNLSGSIAQTDFDDEGNAINGDMNKRPFENYVLTTALHLKEGDNQIRLVTNNKEDHGGTFNAETPLIDCMYIYTDAELTWANCYPENVGKTMADVTYDVTYDTVE